MSDYQFIDANKAAWRQSTFAEGIDVKDLGTANGGFCVVSSAVDGAEVHPYWGACSPRMRLG